jgi:hypothetical protein
MYKKWLMAQLYANKNKNFVQRILNPSQYPTLDLGNGNYETHLMAWGDDGQGNYFVYPTVVHDAANKKLVKLDDRAAWDYAMKSGEYIKYAGKDTAEWVSQNYKLAWQK